MNVPEIVVVGAASRDVDPADPRGWRLGGAVCYISVALGRLGMRVGACVGLDPEARQADELALLPGAGVEVHAVPLPEGPVFDNREGTHGRIQVCLQPSAALAPSALPAAWAQASVLVLAPVAAELGDAWADQLPGARLVALGWQGALRRLRSGERTAPLPPRRSPLLRRADLITVSRDDLRGAGPGDPLDTLVGRAGQQLVVTAGRRGGLLVWRDGSRLRARRYAALPARAETDPTGVGDAFLAGWIAGTLAMGRETLPGGRVTDRRPDRPCGRALRFGALVAALKVEERGIDGLPDRAALARRARELSALPSGLAAPETRPRDAPVERGP